MTFWTDLAEVPFEITWVQAAGLRTRTLQTGPSDGEPVVFLHGTSGHLEAFLRNVPAFAAAGYRCHAIDMMGHGYTEGQDEDYEIPGYVRHLVGYLDTVGIRAAHLVGESLGGWVSARTAVDHPERVRTLQLVAAGGTKANPEVMAKIKESTTRAVVEDDIAFTRKRLELLMFDPVNVSDELVEVRHAIYHRPSFQQALPHLLAMQTMEIRVRNLLTAEQMAAITVPTLVVWGRQNPFGDVPEAHAMHEAIRGSHLELFDECGHWPQHEHAPRFNTLSLEFLQSAHAEAAAAS